MSYRISSLSVALLIALALTGWKLWEQATAYEMQTLEIIQQLETKAMVENQGRALLESITFGLYQGYTEQLREVNEAKSIQDAYLKSVYILSIVFLIIAALVTISAWFLRKRMDDVGYALVSISLISLFVGLSTPILSVQTSKVLPVIGETVLQFQSKGVISSIDALIEHGNFWIASLLTLFSIVTPVLKTTIVMVTLFTEHHHLTIKGLNLSKSIGKWSMADVFIVAIIVVFFTTEQEVLTKAEVGPGLWFFSSYVLLSLVGTQLVSRSIQSN